MREAFAVLLVALNFAGCRLGLSPQKAAGQAASKYLAALIHGRYDEAYALLTAGDRAAYDLEHFRSRFTRVPNEDWPFLAVLADKTSFSIGKVDVSGDKGVVQATVSGPDGAGFVRQMVLQSVLKGLGSKPGRLRDAVQKAAAKAPEDLKVNKDLQMVQESDGWKVFLDFAAKVRRIQEYAPDIKIEVLRSAKGSPAGPGLKIDGEVKNAGKSTLKGVAVSVYLLDAAGQRLGKKDTFIAPEKKLPPGQSEKFGIQDKDIPAGWSGKVETEVEDIVFE
jgi:hypothetical protein